MATEQTDCRAWFSNFSPSTATSQYNIAAPGWQIYSTLPGAGYGSMSGTSMATPIVAGSAALVWGQIPGLTRDTLVTRLLSYGQPISCGFKVSTKRVDVRKAILGTSETAVIGHVFDPFRGTSPSPPTTPVKVDLKSGTTILKTDNTNTGGSYEMTGLAAGTSRALWGSGTGYINTLMRYPITITLNKVNGPYWDGIVKSRASKNASLVIDWKNSQPVNKVTGQCEGACLGWDFDLFVKAPSGYYYWGNPGDLLTTPYIFYARDSANDLVPMETTIIGSPAATGIHKVFVDRYPYSGSFNQTYAGSKIQFQVFNGAAAVARYDTCPCTTQRYWYIGDLTKTATGYTWANKNLCQVAAP
jgi:subtilisin family serine protease